MSNNYLRSPLFRALQEMRTTIERLPGREPIIMAEVDDDRILNVTMHCPECGCEDLAELDWSTRWNDLCDPGFGTGSTGNAANLFVSVMQDDGDYETLAWFCTGCGQVLDMTGIETIWS